MSVTLMNSVTLSASTVPSSSLLISGGQLNLFFTIVVTGSAATVTWYLEFTDEAPASGPWYQEVAEEDGGMGVVSMPKVVRTFADAGATTLAIGTHTLAVPFVRPGPIARVQIAATGGTAVCTIKSVSGNLAA